MSIIANPTTIKIFFEKGKEKEASIRAENYQNEIFSKISKDSITELINSQKGLIKELNKIINDCESGMFDEKGLFLALKEVHDLFMMWCCFKSVEKIPQEYVHNSTIEIVETLGKLKVLPEITNDIHDIITILRDHYTGVYIDALNF